MPDPAEADPEAWLAFHIFYAASPRPLLTQCVRPLTEALTDEGLLAGYFFINYWLEGPHLRLRLRPARPQAAPQVRLRAEEAISAFLARRPALYEVKGGFLAELYDTLFAFEYPGERPAHLLDAHGRMRLRKNNSFSLEPYEPEFGKYGGPSGVALAQWHFQHSSNLVIEVAQAMNLHLRTVVLGLAGQLMMTTASCFLPEREDLLAFLDRYHAFWNGAFEGTNYTARDGYDRAYQATDASLPKRFQMIREAVAADALERLPGLLGLWARHCLELRARVLELTDRGELLFRSQDGKRDLRVTDPSQALPMLLSPYAHMTNNRLGVTVGDEAYLSYVLARALREPARREDRP
ncbi:lantibiotic dehydratase C-terminal domain-containing protein [Kitasatospora sp. GAS204B]|uniref:lantibiotic dehydratase C-terminal domain-containing protein n=1 Tax=unclassified Kitasatospora TaxID=2633591 RepID=UPI00247677B4|nr:lantibiotic dehydratase C-terminal domain-containing protein [Kitasatospora sp. GAS204B]